MAGLDADGRLQSVLEEARRRSLVGGLPMAKQIAHSEGFLRALLLESFEGPVLELGSGGGLPGLVLALEDRDLQLVLVDSARRSVEFLCWAVEELQLSARVEVVKVRAEQIGPEDQYRGSFAAVVARSFAPPAVTAECAAPLLRVGGRLIVSEPPATASPVNALEVSPSEATDHPVESLPAESRWPVAGCLQLGLAPELALRDPFGFAVLRQVSRCPDKFPRRTGIPAKRPIFS